MPTKRRRIGARALSRLTTRQQAWLASGSDLLPCIGEEGVEDDAHGRALWIRHRDAVMAADLNCNTPGRRPWGYWRYDIGLEPDGDLGFHWPRGGCSEAETIYRYHADAAERLAIEAEWLDAMRIAIAQSRGAPSPDPEGNAEAFAGVPRSFYRRYAEQVHAD